MKVVLHEEELLVKIFFIKFFDNELRWTIINFFAHFIFQLWCLFKNLEK